jgi:hypothetical protein
VLFRTNDARALVAGIEPWASPTTKQMSELGERPALRRTVFDWVARRRVVEQVNAGELCADKKSVDLSSRLIIEDY